MTNPWGYHLILDLKNCAWGYNDPDAIRSFAKAMVGFLEMKAYGDPQVVHFADHDEDRAGWTLIQLIETSNITAHFCDKTGDAYIDIFSCVEFDSNVAAGYVGFYFRPKDLKQAFISRGDW